MRLASRFFSLLFSFFLSLVCHQVGFITETKELYHRDKRALSQRQKSPITQTKEPNHTSTVLLQVIRQVGYGPKADIWSVACTVIQMLTAEAP